MTNLPFQTYDEAKDHFGIAIPKIFYDTLIRIDRFCRLNSHDTLDTLFDVFGILRIEGKEARYQQTPIEFFPFGSIGSDGIHYGFVVHTLGEEDYPSGELCPMDSDGVVVIGNNSTELFQNLLQDKTSIDNFLPLLRDLKLEPVLANRNRYDESDNALRVKVKPKENWKYLQTSDGVGVFAEEHYFDIHHGDQYNFLNRNKAIEKYEKLAIDMEKRKLYASQLYYLKELYWNEWTNYELAKKYLSGMLICYQNLNRQHLYHMAKWTIETFDKRYGV
jgi:hypothetical protein